MLVIAILDMMLPRGHEAETSRALHAFWDSTSALPGCVGGGVFQEVGGSDSALYVEVWNDVSQLEVHVRSREYGCLLAIMETSRERPSLGFNFVAESRGLEWVEELRLGTAPGG